MIVPLLCPHETLPEVVSPALETTALEEHGVGSKEAMKIIRGWRTSPVKTG